MVNPGKRSGGCHTCRKRHVKCDERRPTCVRCEKAKRQCGGWRTELDLVFRNENEVAQKNALLDLGLTRRKQASRDDLEVGPSSGAGQLLVFDQEPIVPRGTSYLWTPPESRTPTPPFPSLNTRTLLPPNGGHVMLCHLYMAEKTSQNLSLRIARDLQLQAAPSSALIPLAESIAWINAPVDYDSKSAIFEATKGYADAVIKLRNTIARPEPAPLNETIIIILWMTKAEMAISEPSAVGMVILNHLRGALSFIRASTQTNPLPNLFAPIVIELINHTLACWISSPVQVAIELGREFEYIHKLTGSFSQLPEGSLRLVQLGMTATQVHTVIKSYRNISWSGITLTHLKTLYAKCGKALALISQCAYLWTPGSLQLSSDEQDRLFSTVTVWNRSRQETISLFERKDWGQVCTYRLLTYVGTRQCAMKYIELAKKGPKNAYDPMAETLVHVEKEMKAATEGMIREIKEYMRMFLTGKVTVRSPSETAQAGTANKSTPRIGSYMMMLPLRIARSIKDLSDEAKADLEAATDTLVQCTGLERPFWMPRLHGNIFD